MDVSVILAVKDGAGELAGQLQALASQEFGGAWELLLVDNGSTDRTLEVAAEFADRLPMRVVDGTSARGAAGARNLGASLAKGDLLLFCDHDDEVDVAWIDAMVAGLRSHPAIGGALELDALNQTQYKSLRRGTWTQLPTIEGFLPYCPTANFGIRARAFELIGGFDTVFDVAHDVDISVRLQLAGFELAFAADAVVHYRDRASLLATARQRYAYGRERPLLYRHHRHRGFPRTPPLRGMIDLALLVPLAVRSLPSGPARRWWVRTAAQRVGRVAGSIRHRVFYL